MSEPTTAEGRALLAREDYNSRSFALITPEAITAIEAAAAEAERARIRAAVERVFNDPGLSTPGRSIAAVLAAIDAPGTAPAAEADMPDYYPEDRQALATPADRTGCYECEPNEGERCIHHRAAIDDEAKMSDHDSGTARERALAAGPDTFEAFIRECVERNPGGYTEDFRFLLDRLRDAGPRPDSGRPTWPSMTRTQRNEYADPARDTGSRPVSIDSIVIYIPDDHEPDDEELAALRTLEAMRDRLAGPRPDSGIDDLQWLIDHSVPTHSVVCAGQDEDDPCICGVSDRYVEILARLSTPRTETSHDCPGPGCWTCTPPSEGDA